MRKQKIILGLVILLFAGNLFGQITFTENFPFKIGNVFIFKDYSYGCCPPGSSTKYRKSIITKDTLINSKKYLFINGYYMSYVNRWWRLDSTSGVLFSFDTTVVCSDSYHERKIDSLWSIVGDSIKDCSRTGFICTALSNTTIFNINKPSKKFESRSTFTGGTSFTTIYCKDFGMTYFAYSGGRAPYYSGRSYELKGCILNGVLYGDTNTIGIELVSLNTPDNYSLNQNYPNPFNPSTKINYELRNSNFVTLKVFDLLGKEVASLVNEKQNAGSYAVDFNSTEFSLPSGIYFYTLSAGEFKETRKMVLIK